jgi:Stress responsive A/B Barrel Domain
MTLRHVVLFGFGKAQSPAAVAEVIRRFAELKERVPGVEDFEWGENLSLEGLDHGHSHAFLLTFANSEAPTPILCIPITQPLRAGSSHCVFGDGPKIIG